MKKEERTEMKELIGDAIDRFYRRLDAIGMVCDIADMEVFVEIQEEPDLASLLAIPHIGEVDRIYVF